MKDGYVDTLPREEHMDLGKCELQPWKPARSLLIEALHEARVYRQSTF